MRKHIFSSRAVQRWLRSAPSTVGDTWNLGTKPTVIEQVFFYNSASILKKYSLFLSQ